MLPAWLKPELINDESFHRNREKAFGFMWGGSCDVEINGAKIHLELWHHGGDTETKESVKPHYTIKMVNGKDAYWYCCWDNESLWIHPTGWFKDHNLEDAIPKVNPNFTWRILDYPRMVELGFIRLI